MSCPDCRLSYLSYPFSCIIDEGQYHTQVSVCSVCLNAVMKYIVCWFKTHLNNNSSEFKRSYKQHVKSNHSMFFGLHEILRFLCGIVTMYNLNILFWPHLTPAGNTTAQLKGDSIHRKYATTCICIAPKKDDELSLNTHLIHLVLF